jgi:hypothetical protein
MEAKGFMTTLGTPGGTPGELAGEDACATWRSRPRLRVQAASRGMKAFGARVAMPPGRSASENRFLSLRLCLFASSRQSQLHGYGFRRFLVGMAQAANRFPAKVFQKMRYAQILRKQPANLLGFLHPLDAHAQGRHPHGYLLLAAQPQHLHEGALQNAE